MVPDDAMNGTGPTIPGEPLVSMRDVAHALGGSVTSVQRMTKAGIPSRVLMVRTRRYYMSEILAWVEAQNEQPQTGQERGGLMAESSKALERVGAILESLEREVARSITDWRAVEVLAERLRHIASLERANTPANRNPDRDLSRVRNPDDWPFRPFLPVHKIDGDEKISGFIREDDVARDEEIRVFDISTEQSYEAVFLRTRRIEDLSTPVMATFESLERMFAAGWEVA